MSDSKKANKKVMPKKNNGIKNKNSKKKNNFFKNKVLSFPKKNSKSKKNKKTNKKKNSNLKIKNKKSFTKKILTLFNKKNKTKRNISSKKIKALFNKKIDVRKSGHLTKEMYIFIFLIIDILTFNLSLLASRIIPFEYYNSIEFLTLVFFNPFILIIEGMMYGAKFGFSYFVAIFMASIFILSIFIFLKIEFAFYLPIYFIFIISSEICGVALSKVKRI